MMEAVKLTRLVIIRLILKLKMITSITNMTSIWMIVKSKTKKKITTRIVNAKNPEVRKYEEKIQNIYMENQAKKIRISRNCLKDRQK